MGPMDFLMDLTMDSAKGSGPVIQVSSAGPKLKGPEAFGKKNCNFSGS